MWLGKFIVGVLGFAYAGFFGGVIGLFVGHAIDKRLNRALNPVNPAKQREIEKVFFTTVFTLLGKLAKADGRISEQEVSHTERLMSEMGLTAEHRQEAIRLFKQGAQPDFSPDAVIQRFNVVCGRGFNLRHMLLNYLVSLAIADGQLAAAEEAALRDIAGRLGFPGAMLGRLIEMIKAQAQFKYSTGQGNYQQRPSTESELQTAYQALGVTPSQSDAEIKKAYRKLISENHPDKLMGQGVPEDMIKLATERSQEIQTAYDIIVKHRKR